MPNSHLEVSQQNKLIAEDWSTGRLTRLRVGGGCFLVRKGWIAALRETTQIGMLHFNDVAVSNKFADIPDVQEQEEEQMKFHRMTQRLFVTIVSLLLVTVSCSSAKPQLPDGTFTVGPSGDQTETTLSAGRYQSVLVSVLSTGVVEEGAFVVKDDQITFTQEKATGANLVACGSTTKPYTYKWTYDQKAKTITFVNVDDPCDARRSRRESGPLPYKEQTK